MTPSILVRRPSDLSIAWAQRVVDKQNSDITVSSIKVLSVDIGTTTRIRVTVEHDGMGNFPRCWFVKLPSLSWLAWMITALPRLLPTEVCFYKEMSHSVPVNKPTVLAAQSRFGLGATLVLADVNEFGAIPGLPSDSLTVEQAMLVIDQLAQLHACFWNSATLDRDYSWLGDPVRRLEDRLGKVLAIPLMKRGLRLAGGIIPDILHEPAIQYARQRDQAMHTLSQGPHTLIHHDCHPGNIFWNKSRPGLLDWQLVRIGEGISDIAYFLATALEPEIRKTHEANLLEHYRRVLANHGITLDSTKLLQRYRAHLIYPFEAMLVTLAIGGMMDVKSNLELIRRATAAVEDQDVFEIYLVQKAVRE